MPDTEKISELSESIKKYINTNIELIQLSFTERFSVLGADLIARMIIGLILVLCVFFISLAAGFYISSLIGNSFSGFAIIGCCYLLLGILLIIKQKKFLKEPLRDILIRKIQNKE